MNLRRSLILLLVIFSMASARPLNPEPDNPIACLFESIHHRLAHDQFWFDLLSPDDDTAPAFYYFMGCVQTERELLAEFIDYDLPRPRRSP